MGVNETLSRSVGERRRLFAVETPPGRASRAAGRAFASIDIDSKPQRLKERRHISAATGPADGPAAPE
jgi:hypothetical protein